MKPLHDLALKYKLSLAPFVCLVMLAAVATLALWGFGRLASALDQVYAKRLPSYVFSARLESDVRDMNGLINQSIALAAVGYGDEDISKIDQSLVKLIAQVQETLKTRAAEPSLDGEEREAVSAIAADFEKYRKSLRETLTLKATALVSAAAFFGNAQAEYARLLARISALSKRQLDGADALVAQTLRTAEDARALVLAAAAAAVLFAVAAVVAVTRGLLRRVRSLSGSARRLAVGDLTEPVQTEGDDEVGRLMADVETVRRQLAESLRKVHEAADSLRVAATQIAASSFDLGARTETTSASLQEAASSLHQLTMAVDQNASTCNLAAQGSSEAADEARKGGALMSRVVETMQDISHSSKRIGEVIAVIDRIAEQTNILALNAAVESARAGDHGKGFAVVAGEVRTLANKSREAAREIASLIGSSNQRIEAGQRLVQEAGASVAALVARACDVSSVVSDIRSAAVTQGSDIATVNEAVSAVDRGTQANAALVEESTAAAEGLRVQAQNLSEAIEQFKLDEG